MTHTPPAPCNESIQSLSRRAFVRSAVGVTVAIPAACFGLTAARPGGRAASAIRTADKSGLANPILGEGEHTYECIHDWLTPPDGLLWGDTHGLAQTSDGRIVVAHTVHGESLRGEAVAVFGEDGVFDSAWGDEFRGGAHGLDVREEPDGEFLYHCDTGRRLVVKTDLAGRSVWESGWPEESGRYEARERYCPTNVAFHPDGDVYIGDGYGSSFIHRFTRDGRYVRTIAGPGSAPGQVSCPHGLWVDERSGRPRLAVADRSNRRIQYLSIEEGREGEHLGFVTDGIRLPCHFKVRDGLLLVPDLESVVTVLDAEDRVIVHLGDGHPSGLRGRPRSDFIPGRFIHPHTAIWLRNGDILVAEWVPVGRITLLRLVGA